MRYAPHPGALVTPSPAATASVVLLVRGLADLAGWQPVDALVERAVAAARGDDGLSAAELRLLAGWSMAWRSVRPEIRSFYRAALAAGLAGSDAAAVDAGIRSFVDLRHVDGWARGRLAYLYVQLTGEDAGFPLCAG